MAPRMMVFLLLLSIPFWISVSAVWHWRGIWRVTAIFPLLILAYALAGDIYSATQGGNLTGMATLIFYGPPSLLFLLLLWVAKGFANLSDSSPSPATSFRMAAWSSAFRLACVVFLWLVGFGFLPVGSQFGKIGMVLYWIVGGALALAVVVYPLRAAVKRQATKEPVGSSTEVVETEGISKSE